MNKNFIDTLEKHFGITNFLKLDSISFSQQDNTLNISIMYNTDYNELFKNVKDEIVKCITDYVGNEVDTLITFKKSFIDEEYLIVLINKFLHESDSNLLKRFYYSDIKVVKNNFEFNVHINADINKNMSDYYDIAFEDFSNKLSESGFYKINVKINYLDEKIDENYIDNYIEKLRKEEIKKDDDDQFEIEEKTAIVGDLIEETPVLPEIISSPTDYIATLGECHGIRKVEYKKQRNNAETGEVTESDALRYTFKLKYQNASVNCTYFPRKSDYEKPFPLNEGDTVLLDGKVDAFMGNVSIIVKNINLCKMKTKEQKPREFLPIPDNYTVVFPEPFYSEEQVDMFSILDEKKHADILDTTDFVVFDLETTGLNPIKDTIIEISAIKIQNGQMTESFNTFVNPQRKIPQEVVELTNITDDMVKNAPIGDEVIGDYLKFCKGCTLVAYNAPFDMSFLQNLADKNDYKVDNNVDDALVLARKKIFGLKNYKLKTVAQYLNVDLIGAHRAINDTLATAKVYLKLLDL